MTGGRDARRDAARTWYPKTAAAPVAQVQDEAVRAIMLARRRALLLEAAAIARHCGLDVGVADDQDTESVDARV